jgi:alanyl-tRNA synthetase
METESLYYSQPDLAKTDATVLAVEEDGEGSSLFLDRTIFYPEGGGQPGDLGSVEGLPLGAVTLEAGRVRHRLAAALPKGLGVGSRVSLVLDEARRRDHTEQHSGQHLFSSTLNRLFGAATASFHLGVEDSTIDLAPPFIDIESAREAEKAVNAAIAADYRIHTHLCPPEDIASFPLRRRPPESEEILRVVEIDGLDYTPCCGTHASSTGRLRLLLVLGSEKYKGLTRIRFVAGGRAVAAAASCLALSQAVSRALGVGAADLEAEALRLVERAKGLQTELRSLVRTRARDEAEALIAGGGGESLSSLPYSVALGGGPGPFVLCFADRDAEAALEACKALAERGRLAMAASLPDLVVCAVAPARPSAAAPGSAAASAALGSRLAPLAAAAGGKGGGGPAFFRASFPDGASLRSFLASASEILQN